MPPKKTSPTKASPTAKGTAAGFSSTGKKGSKNKAARYDPTDPTLQPDSQAQNAPTQPALSNGPSASGPTTPRESKGSSSPRKPAAVFATPAGRTRAPSDPSASPGGLGGVKGQRSPKEEAAARVIQSAVRMFLARRSVARRVREKKEYLALMDKLEKEAYVKLVKDYQDQMAVERKKEEEEKRRRQELAKRKKRMLTAAFDGDVDAIQAIIKEITADKQAVIGQDAASKALLARNQLALIDCEDANNNTPLSEAAAGGSAEVIQLLIELGADPNSRGRFARTPLYRAAFAGNLEAAQTLLRHGADPRLYAEDGQTPAQICTFDAVRALLEGWDVTLTDALAERMGAERTARAEEERKRIEAEAGRLEEGIGRADSDYKFKQKKLCKAVGEVEKRIKEHDKAVATGFARPDITLECIRVAELDRDFVREEVEQARDKLAQLKLQLRDKQAEGKGLASGGDVDQVGLKVKIRELDDVLMRDIGNRIRDSGKWPLLIDPSGQATTFLRYRDTNYVNALSPQQVVQENIRIAILGALRYGKPLVLDMMEVDMFDAMTTRFDEVQRGLMNSIMDKSILTEACYLKLLKAGDDPEYGRNQFTTDRLNNFKFVVITKNPMPASELVEKTYPIRIDIPLI